MSRPRSATCRPTCKDLRCPARCVGAATFVQAGVSPRVLAPQLRRHRAFRRLHRAARGLGAGPGRTVGRHAQRRDAGDARHHGHRGAALQRFLYLSLGTGHRFPEIALCAEPPGRFGFGATIAARNPSPTGCASCWCFGGTSRLRATICTGWKRCSRRPVTSTFSMAWASGPRPKDFTRGDYADRADGYFREAAQLTRKMLGALPSNRDLVDHIRNQGLPRKSKPRSSASATAGACSWSSRCSTARAASASSASSARDRPEHPDRPAPPPRARGDRRLAALPGPPAAAAYALTADGHDLAGALRLLADWGARRADQRGSAPARAVRHARSRRAGTAPPASRPSTSARRRRPGRLGRRSPGRAPRPAALRCSARWRARSRTVLSRDEHDDRPRPGCRGNATRARPG